MAQWFPKIAEYDRQGWHAHPYIAREFYAPWGNFDVSISINKKYVVACSHAWVLRAVLGGNTFYGRASCTQHGGRDNPFTDGYTAFARMFFGPPAFFWGCWYLIFWSEIRRGLHS